MGRLNITTGETKRKKPEDLRIRFQVSMHNEDKEKIKKAKGKMAYGAFYVFCCKLYLDSLGKE